MTGKVERRRKRDRMLIEGLQQKYKLGEASSSSAAVVNLPSLLDPVRLDERILYQSSKKSPLINKSWSKRMLEIDQTPIAVLDCPGLRDDFYLNILDWSVNNFVYVALEDTVYSYDYNTRRSEYVTSTVQKSAYVSALCSMLGGKCLIVGNSDGCFSIFDSAKGRELRTASVPKGTRIGTISCRDSAGMFGENFFAMGTRNGQIYTYDIRTKLGSFISCLEGHSLEVCGLQMATDSWQMASGGNDNKVLIWDIRRTKPLHVQDTYGSAIKAIGWCPWRRNLLAVGSGTNDRGLYFWNSCTNELLKSTTTDSQVCGLLWSSILSEVITTHGYATNDLQLWSYPSLERSLSITAHETRILHCALSPDGTTVATCAGNENLKFWKLYNKRPTLRQPQPSRIQL